MLVIGCQFGQWIKITDSSGKVLPVRVMDGRVRGLNDVRLVFDDDAHHFAIDRPNRRPPNHAIAAVSNPPGLADKT
jgi:hypothetical protein